MPFVSVNAIHINRGSTLVFKSGGVVSLNGKSVKGVGTFLSDSTHSYPLVDANGTALYRSGRQIMALTRKGNRIPVGSSIPHLLYQSRATFINDRGFLKTFLGRRVCRLPKGDGLQVELDLLLRPVACFNRSTVWVRRENQWVRWLRMSDAQAVAVSKNYVYVRTESSFWTRFSLKAQEAGRKTVIPSNSELFASRATDDFWSVDRDTDFPSRVSRWTARGREEICSSGYRLTAWSFFDRAAVIGDLGGNVERISLFRKVRNSSRS